jgi:hypothetical protein
MMIEQQNETFENLLNVDLSKFIRTIASNRKSYDEYEEIKHLENLSVIWIDSNLDQTIDCLDTKNYLYTFLTEHLKTYNDPDKFIKYLSTENNSQRIFLIVSGSFGESLIPRIKDHPSIIFIYIFCLNSTYHKQWTHSYSNIRDVFTDKTILIDRLVNDIRLYTSNIPAFSILNLTNEEKSMRDLTKENAIFMCYQLLIDILLRMSNNDNTNSKQEMLKECRLHYEKNKQKINLIEEFDTTYSSTEAIKWYTRDCFLFRLLNKAFRTENIDIIYKFRFFIIDLYQQLKQIHSDYIEYMGLDEIITVYRGQ